MGITPQFSQSDIEAKLDEHLRRVQQAIIMRLQRLGEKCVNEARESGSYIDRTGNLRSSIGYVIVANGMVINENFKREGEGKIKVQSTSLKTKKTTTKTMRGGTDGVATGISLAHVIAAKFPTGYVLIVVAGMDYATYVEANGLNVLSTAESLAIIQLPIMMKQLKLKL